MERDRETLQAWEDLIEAAEKSNIPMKFISRLTLYFIDVDIKPQDIDVRELRRQGWEDEKIEMFIGTIIKQADSTVYSIEFLVDVENVAHEVQNQTEKLLGNIK